MSDSNSLPDYIRSAQPNPQSARAPWYKNTAPTYAGIFLWFVFWDGAVATDTSGGLLAQGLPLALGSLILSALVCHFLFYLVPGMFGMRTGLPLYIVGTSTFGAQGGFFMPGFLMGLLQFGWLGVNVYFSAQLLHETLSFVPVQVLMVAWGVLAAFMGLKGIQYVARVATYLPLIPLIVLLVLLSKTAGGVGDFDPGVLKFGKLEGSLDLWGVVAAALTYVVGFFATAGAAGVDFGTGSRDEKDVHRAGLVGVALAIAFTACAAAVIVAGAYGMPEIAMKAKLAGSPLQVTALMKLILGEGMAKTLMFLLALAAFPAACFSSFIAANCFKTTLPKVNPFVSVGAGAAVSIILALTGLAGKAIIVFQVIGASFGPICGAMLVEYFLNQGKWPGPRAGFNPAGWLSWAAGFVVGLLPIIKVANVPAAPVAAFVVGAVVYFACAKAGLESKRLQAG